MGESVSLFANGCPICLGSFPVLPTSIEWEVGSEFELAGRKSLLFFRKVFHPLLYMPNKRGEGQVFIGLQATAELLRELDAARGLDDRSRFIRKAIVEKLKRMGVRIPKRFIYPPDRSGRQVVQFVVGQNNRGHITQTALATEEPGKYKAKKRKKK